MTHLLPTSIISIKLKPAFYIRIAIFMAAIASIFLLQSIKADYRKVIWSNKSENINRNKVDVFYNAVSTKLGEEDLTKNETNMERFLERLNTGFITAKVFKHTPSKQEFSNGEELSSDLVAVLLPRFLFPNKKKVEGSDNREKLYKYAGKKIGEGTIMRVGAVADSYLNFGLVGGSIFMFVFGLILNYLLLWMKFQSIRFPLIIFWIPIIFTFVVRMSDFIVLINSVFKILILLLIFINYLPSLFLYRPLKNI